MKHLPIGLSIIFALAVPAFSQDSIAPTTFSATLPVGTSTSVNKVVTVGKVTKPVDIMFLLDTTGSMGAVLSSLDASFASNVSVIDTFASDVQFAVGDYKDKFQCAADPYAYKLDQNITNTNSLVQTALSSLTANGGCDNPESQLFGLAQAASTTSWRAGSTRILVWVGDFPGHDPAGTTTEAQAIAALKAAGVIVIAASAQTGGSPGLDGACDSSPCGSPNNNQAARITAATGGQDLASSTPANINAAIQTAIKNAISMYSTVSLGVSPVPAGVTITISPASFTGTFDRSATRTFNFTVGFTGTVPGVYNFGINALVDGATIATESDSIGVTAQPPVLSKSFNPTKILPGGTSILTLSISNPNAAAVTNVGVVDTLPGGVTATGAGATNTCGGTVTITAGSVTLAGGSIAAAGTCTITVQVTSNEGIKVNTTQAVTSAFGTGNTATATLSAATPPVLSKAFGEVSIGPLNTVGVTFNLSNPNAALTLTGLAFNDTLPAGLKVAVPSVVAGTCDAGTITAVAGGNAISLAGASLAAGASCTFTVNVTADGTVQGTITNTTGAPTSTQSIAGTPATAKIFVGDPFQISYAANLAIGDSFVNITNTGALGASLQSGTTASITGALCANIYAFTPDEQLVSCCSCPVTPNGLVSLSVKNDLASNTLTPAVPTALVIKLMASVPVGGSCNNSAAAVSPASLANGMKAYGSTLHQNTSAQTSSYGVTETPFLPAQLSAGELNRATSLCNFIIANGSGFGICRSCRLGGLGSDRQ